MTPESAFSTAEQAAVYRAIHERRDMRHFAPGAVDETVLARLFEAAHAAPSVGLMQPWRFMRIRDPQLRAAISDLVGVERQATAQALGIRGGEFLNLKVEGVRDCSELLVAALAPDDGTVFGRRTLAHETALGPVARPGLVVLRSRGKFFGLAGARVGFVLAAPELLDTLREKLGPWPVAGPSRTIASAALADGAWQLATRARLAHDSDRLAALLTRHGLRPAGGSALFQWVPAMQAAGPRAPWGARIARAVHGAVRAGLNARP